MTQEVKRYEVLCNGNLVLSTDGQFVMFTDHAAVVAERDAARQQLSEYESTDHELLKTQHTKLVAAQAEVERLRGDFDFRGGMVDILAKWLDDMKENRDDLLQQLKDIVEAMKFSSEAHTVGRDDQWLTLATRILCHIDRDDVSDGIEAEFQRQVAEITRLKAECERLKEVIRGTFQTAYDLGKQRAKLDEAVGLLSLCARAFPDAWDCHAPGLFEFLAAHDAEQGSAIEKLDTPHPPALS